MSTLIEKSPELERQMYLPRQPGDGVIGKLVKEGHRHLELFDLNYWFKLQHIHKTPDERISRTSRAFRYIAAESVLDALDAGHELNHTAYIRFLTMVCSFSKTNPSLRPRAVFQLEKWIDQGVFLRFNYQTQSVEERLNNNLTATALAACAQLDSLPLLKKMCEVADLTQLSKLDTPFLILGRTTCFPEQLPMLKFLLEETKNKNIIWPHKEDKLRYLLRPALSFLNRKTVSFLIEEMGVDIHDSFMIEYSKEKGEWAGALTGAIGCGVNKSFLPREELFSDLIALLQDLIDFGAPIDPPIGHDSLLNKALESTEQMRRSYEIIKWMLDQGSDPNYIGSSNRPPLWFAVQQKQYDVVDLLIERGADINFINLDHNFIADQSVLGQAAAMDDVEMFTHLLSKDADITLIPQQALMDQAGPAVSAFLERQSLNQITSTRFSPSRSLRL